MTHGISGLSPRASLDATQALGATQGNLGGATVEAAPAQPRAGNALKTAWLEVRHFFASLVGMRVSTTKPETVADAPSATQGALHALTKRDLDTLDVAEALGGMMEHGGFPRDEARAGLSDGAAALFRPALQGLSDLQLMRLQVNLARSPALLEGLAQSGTGALMALPDVPDLEQMTGAGRVDDLGFLTMALRDCLTAEMTGRGLEAAELRGDPGASDRGLEHFTRHALANGGDLRAAADAARADLAQERQDAVLDALEQAGLYTREAETPPSAPPAAAALPDNSAVSAPFGEARSAWIVGTLNEACLPQNQAREHTHAIPVGPTGDFEVAWIFKRDMTGPRDISFAGERLPGTGGGTEALDANVAQFCQALGEKGVSKGDLLAMSRVINQATTGVVASQFMLDPGNAPGLRLADGDTVPIVADLKGGAWTIAPSGTGYEIGYRAGQDLDGSVMATQGGQIFRFGEDSRLDVSLTFVLDRGADGNLTVTGMRDSRIALQAFDAEGRQLA